MKLNADQKQKFEEDGYLLLGQFLTEAEAERMGEIYLDCVDGYVSTHETQVVNKIRQDDGSQSFFQLRCAHLMHPEFDAIVRDERLLDAVESLIGPNLRLVISQGMYKPPNTGGEIRWHQDNYYFRVDKPNAVVSCWLTFDDATVDNGCMWVVPGAHKQMVEHLNVPSGAGFYMPDVDEERAVSLQMKRGHCMLHHGLMPHRTLANTTSTHRRALAIHYMDAMARPSENRQQEPLENRPLLRGRGIDP